MNISEILRGKQVIRRVMKDLNYFIPNWNDSDFDALHCFAELTKTIE